MITRKFRILLADDNEFVRWLLAFSLRKAPLIEVVGEASSGQAVFDLTKKHEPDAIVLESSMQMAGGSKAFGFIQSEFPKVQLIELSLFDDPASRRMMVRASGSENFFDRIVRDAVLAALFVAREP
jgi:DNA-binding NarL/FixJ family response regulator